MTVTHERLLELFFYDENSGEFIRRVTKGNRHKAGQVAGTIHTNLDGMQYKIIGIDRQYYKASRLAWFYKKGEWPKNQIDHIDHDSLNNRWNNFREASNGQNQCNKKRQSNNSSGYKNVIWEEDRKRWTIKFNIDGKQKRCGSFKNLEKAIHEANKFRISLYGEFARHE